MEFREQTITLADGRTLEVATYGDPTGHAVLFHHGSPGCTRSLRELAPLADDHPIFLLTTSRPGYGASTRSAGRNIAAVVPDATAVLDYFRVDDYVALGWSGGGPHALACAAFDVPRCLGAVVLAGVAPADVDFDWTAGMGPENVEEFALAREGGPTYEAHLSAIGDALARADATNIIELFGGLLSDADKSVLASEASRASFAAGVAYAFHQGWRGFFDDDQAFMTSWGFHPGAIEVPVDLFFGDEDLMVPPSHGEWLDNHLRHSSVHRFAAEGHVSVVENHLDEVADAVIRSYH